MLEDDAATLIFEREYDLEGDGRGTLQLIQHGEGDVNCVVWDAALVLAKYLEIRDTKEPRFLKGKKIIELGAGTGCVGLVAATLGANVTITDQCKGLPLLEENIKKNEKLISTFEGSIVSNSLDWVADSSKDLGECDVLLLADCVYYAESITPLINTINRLCTPSTEILLCQEERSYSDVQSAVWKQFYRDMGALFSVHRIEQADQHPLFSSNDIMLIRFKKLAPT